MGIFTIDVDIFFGTGYVFDDWIAFGKASRCRFFDEGKNVGAYFADWVVVDLVIVELKACADLLEENEAQLTNYVRVTDIEVGLLLNFGRNPKKKRKAFSNEYKIKGPGLKTLERNEGHFYKCNLFHLSNLYNLRSGKILKDGAL